MRIANDIKMHSNRITVGTIIADRRVNTVGVETSIDHREVSADRRGRRGRRGQRDRRGRRDDGGDKPIADMYGERFCEGQRREAAAAAAAC